MTRKDAGVVDRAALEMRCTGNCTGGSNPSLSAQQKAMIFSSLFLFSLEREGFVQSVAVWQSNLHFGRRLLRNVSSLRELLLPKINFRPSISQIRQSSIAPTSFALLKPAATGRIRSGGVFFCDFLEGFREFKEFREIREFSDNTLISLNSLNSLNSLYHLFAQ